MSPRLQTSLGQKLLLTPQLHQAIHLLQLPLLELEAEIAQALESNPLLDWEEPSDTGQSDGEAINGDSREPDSAEIATDTRDERSGEDTPDLDWTPEYDSGWMPGGSEHDSEPVEQAEQPDTLHDHLLWQLHLGHFSPLERDVAVAIIEAIEDDGYLREPLQDIAAGLLPERNVGSEDMARVLRMVQAMDPVGVGARDLGECLGLQLQALDPDTPGRSLALRICRELLEQLPRASIDDIARQLDSDAQAVTEALELLRSMDPRPGARHAPLGHDTYITPDCTIWRQEGVWRVTLASSRLSRLCIHGGYEKMIEHARGEDARYLRHQLQEARWLLKNIQSRGETLLKVVHCLIQAQAGYLEFGPRALRPLTLREVANEIGMHESTVSRAVSRKYVRTSRGTVPLRDFFASGVGTEGGGEASSTAIQDMIRQLVDAENPRKPLSDARLTSELKQRGVNVARRTVAKYREAIGIASSHERVRMA